MKTPIALMTAIIAILTLSGTCALAEDTSPALARLYAAKSIRCQYDHEVGSDFKGAPKVTKVVKDGSAPDTTVTFDSIDLKKGNARMIGNVGAVSLMVMPSEAGITFIESLPPGVKTGFGFDTIYASGAKSGKYPAVSSQHVQIMGKPFPNHAFGYCWILE